LVRFESEMAIPTAPNLRFAPEMAPTIPRRARSSSTLRKSLFGGVQQVRRGRMNGLTNMIRVMAPVIHRQIVSKFFPPTRICPHERRHSALEPQPDKPELKFLPVLFDQVGQQPAVPASCVDRDAGCQGCKRPPLISRSTCSLYSSAYSRALRYSLLRFVHEPLNRARRFAPGGRCCRDILGGQ